MNAPLATVRGLLDQTMSENTSTGDSERQRLVEIMALLDEADRKFNGLGGRQSMSVGPVLSDVAALREELTERGKNYGLLPASTSVDELRNEAYRCVEVEARYLDTGSEQ